MSVDKPLEILLVGLGSMGSIYAHILEKVCLSSYTVLIKQTGKARVTAVARSNYALYTEQGITIDRTDVEVIEGWRPYKGNLTCLCIEIS